MMHKLSFLIIFFIFCFVASGQNNQVEVVANPGDGILTLLKKNGLPASEFNAFIKLNEKNLGPNNTLIAGKRYLLPGQNSPAKLVSSGSTSKTYNLFGPGYKEVKVKTQTLKGATYYLKSGHGGPDPGAIGTYLGHRVCEDEYAYDVILRLGRNLIENGATVHFIIQDKNDGIRDVQFLNADKDEVCYPNQIIPLNQVKRLKQRTEAINALYLKNRNGFHRMIAIHIDSRSKKENIDVFFYHDSRSKTGEKAAKILKRTFETKYSKHQPNRGYHGTVSDRNLFVVRNSLPTSVFIELGNIQHYRDQQRIVNHTNRQALANWLTEGLIEDFKTNK